MGLEASRGWAPICLVLALFASTRVWSQEALTKSEDSPVLVWFDFEGEAVETGPYTLIAYEDARGSVRLTTRYRLSGFRSVEIRDVAGDGEFAELQGFFREMSEGKLYLHFAVLIALLPSADQDTRTESAKLLRALTGMRHGFESEDAVGRRRAAVTRWRAWWAEHIEQFAPRVR